MTSTHSLFLRWTMAMWELSRTFLLNVFAQYWQVTSVFMWTRSCAYNAFWCGRTFPQMWHGNTSFLGVWARIKWFLIEALVLNIRAHKSHTKTSSGDSALIGVWESSSCCFNLYSDSCSFPQKPQIGRYRFAFFSFFALTFSRVSLMLITTTSSGWLRNCLAEVGFALKLVSEFLSGRFASSRCLLSLSSSCSSSISNLWKYSSASRHFNRKRSAS